MKALFALLFFVFSQVTVQAQTVEINRVIGEDDLVLVKSDLSNVPVKFKKMMSAIGKLSSACTVTHIGQGYAVTAGHCFWETFFDGELKQDLPCSEQTITWQWTVDSANHKTSKCLKVIAAQRNEAENLDFAIIKLDNPPAVSIAIDWKKKPNAGAPITIFSYPEEDPLSWSQYCQVKKLTSQDVLPKQLHHLCDTKIGSSGAAVIDAVSGKIVALHRSGDGEFLDDGSMTPATENFAMYITQSPMKNLLIKSGYIIK